METVVGYDFKRYHVEDTNGRLSSTVESAAVLFYKAFFVVAKTPQSNHS